MKLKLCSKMSPLSDGFWSLKSHESDLECKPAAVINVKFPGHLFTLLQNSDTLIDSTVYMWLLCSVYESVKALYN